MASVLYIGEDLCRRIPVMQQRGLSVVLSERSALAVAAALSENLGFDAIAFEHDTFPLPPGIVSTARRHSAAPLVLFENPNIVRYGVDHDRDAFDLIIPALTPPVVWCKALHAVIGESQQICDVSRRLCREAAEARLKLQALRRSIRESLHPIDLNALWRRETNDGPDE